MIRRENDLFPRQKNIAACYIRLSREDGDRSESLSVAHQRLLLQEFTAGLKGFSGSEYYIDDGYTGTSFVRPGFERMKKDIENGIVTCVIVKDLSRLGRDSPETTQYIQEYFPSRKVRFIAIDDGIDKNYFDIDTSEDMMIEMKNMFNGFYPKDISGKVRSTFRAKQRAGQFIGAFACYGYKKSPQDHNQLLIDGPAADVVRRIYELFLSGLGQNTIARKLNEEGIPCPSEYKRSCGLNYRNSNKLGSTTYWTYSSIRNILRNRIYTGTMVQNRSFRQICRHTAIPLPEEKWIVVPDTHEAIIDPETFEKVQDILARGTRHMNLDQGIHIFAGYLKCGDCGRAMIKIRKRDRTIFQCGSYHRYGKGCCRAHSIDEDTLSGIILSDLGAMVLSLGDIKDIVREEQEKAAAKNIDNSSLRDGAAKLQNRKERAYDDYMEGLLSREEYIKYKKRCERQIAALEHQNAMLSPPPVGQGSQPQEEWLMQLLRDGRPEKLDHMTVVEMVSQILIYDDNTVKIIYNFADDYDLPPDSNLS